MLDYVITRFLPTLILCPTMRQHVLDRPFLSQIKDSVFGTERAINSDGSFSQSVSHIIHKD